MEIGLIRKVDIDHEMQQSYLDYAMSVIVARALPDARDGLKPVQRRILYAMYDMGLRPDSSYKKSARIVGEVLGKYHPHGDMAVYEAMARQAQDFSMRYTQVDGQGNFGSVDGDPPAAMRYTEARLTPFAIELLSQLDRNTVDFTPNFDGTLSEPDVLPAAAPNLLINGASGIAVGMATNIPPHNPVEVVEALVFMLHEWDRLDDINVSDLMRFVKGPDFPTGGIILLEGGQNELLSAYGSGRGRVTVRGRVQAEDMGRGKSRLIVTELPYQVNKSALIERIAELVRDGNLEGITDLRDESDRQGMRIVIELGKAADTEQVLRELFKRTPMQTTFGINLLALVDGEPRLLTLKQALKVYLEHRVTVVRRRSEYDLERARQRAHILEGLRIALKNLDEIIALIRGSADVDTARTKLMKRYKLSEAQAQAILDMPLRRLAALERKKIEEEYKELQTLIKELEGLLRSARRMRQVVETELVALKTAYGDKRRTQIVSLQAGESAALLLKSSDLTPAQDMWVGVTEESQIGRVAADSVPRLSGKQAPRWLIKANTHHTLYLVAEDGRAAAASVESLPIVEKFQDGVLLTRVSPFTDGEKISFMFSMPPADELKEGRFVLTTSRLGMVKKTACSELPGPSTQRFTLAKVNPGDSLLSAVITDGDADILLVTAQGMGIRFGESEVRPMGLVAAGVNGIKLAAADQVIGMERVLSGCEVMLLATNGVGWRMAFDEFPLQGRYGQGVIACKPERGSKLVATFSGKKTQAAGVYLLKAAAQAMRLDDIDLVKRMRAGEGVIVVKAGDALKAVCPAFDACVWWEEKKVVARKKRAPASPEAPAEKSPMSTPEVTAKTAHKIQEKAAGTIALKAPKAGGKTAVKAKPKAAGKTATKATPNALVKTTARPKAKRTGKAKGKPEQDKQFSDDTP
jgi:DNA gyrase subunit A